MAKRGVNFDAFDRELADSKPELAARIGVQPTGDSSADVKPAAASPLRVVPSLLEEVEPSPAIEAPAPDRGTSSDSAPKGSIRAGTKLRGRVQRADGSESGRQIVYLPIALDERLRRYAFESGRALTDVTRELLSEAIRNHLPPSG